MSILSSHKVVDFAPWQQSCFVCLAVHTDSKHQCVLLQAPINFPLNFQPAKTHVDLIEVLNFLLKCFRLRASASGKSLFCGFLDWHRRNGVQTNWLVQKLLNRKGLFLGWDVSRKTGSCMKRSLTRLGHVRIFATNEQPRGLWTHPHSDWAVTTDKWFLIPGLDTTTRQQTDFQLKS